MPVRDADERDDGPNDELDDHELPDESDMDDDPDGPDTTPCRYCRTEIFSDAEFCPHCGKYLSREDKPLSNGAWVVITAIAVLAAILIGWLMLLR